MIPSRSTGSRPWAQPGANRLRAPRGVRRGGGSARSTRGLNRPGDSDGGWRERDWIEQLLLYAEMPGVGAVGPTLVRPDGRVSAAGFAHRPLRPGDPVMRGFDGEGRRLLRRALCAREVSALGMECMLVRRSLFERVSGFEEAYSRQFQGPDLCLKLRESGGVDDLYPGPRGRSITRRRRTAAPISTSSTARCSSTAGTSGSRRATPITAVASCGRRRTTRRLPFRADELDLAMKEAAR